MTYNKIFPLIFIHSIVITSGWSKQSSYSLTAYFLENLKDKEIFTQSLSKSPVCAIKIWNLYIKWLRSHALFDNVAILDIFSSIFIITFDWKGKFKFRWFHRQDLGPIHLTQLYFEFRKYFFFYKILFLNEKKKHIIIKGMNRYKQIRIKLYFPKYFVLESRTFSIGSKKQ